MTPGVFRTFNIKWLKVNVTVWKRRLIVELLLYLVNLGR